MASELSRQLVTVYRSPREEGLYLYVAKAEALNRVPETLLKHFGKPEVALDLDLSSNRKLARAKAVDVLSSIHEKGYYLQLPPITHLSRDAT